LQQEEAPQYLQLADEQRLKAIEHTTQAMNLSNIQHGFPDLRTIHFKNKIH
jgi:hypothetical protein